MFAGLAGLGLVAACLAGDGTRYRRLLATLDQALAGREFDLISGLAGVGAYLLLRRDEPGVAPALREVLGALWSS